MRGGREAQGAPAPRPLAFRAQVAKGASSSCVQPAADGRILFGSTDVT